MLVSGVAVAGAGRWRLFAELGVFYFQDVDDAGERGQLLLELVVLAAQIGELVAEQVVVGLQAVGDLRAVVLGFDQGVEQVLESGVLVGELVAPQAGLVGEGFDGELAVGVQWDADE
jgi:hypothetical protein